MIALAYLNHCDHSPAGMIPDGVLARGTGTSVITELCYPYRRVPGEMDHLGFTGGTVSPTDRSGGHWHARRGVLDILW